MTSNTGSGAGPFSKLFEPMSIGTPVLKNRVVMSPVATMLASDTGVVTQTLIDHYARRARGGVGLIITEYACVDCPAGKGGPSQLSLHDDKLISGHAGRKAVECDLIVLAAGVKPDAALRDSMAERGCGDMRVYSIGDCEGAGTLAAALCGGRLAGRQI